MSLTKIKKYFYFFLILLFVDFFLTNFILKRTYLWKKINITDQHWRIKSNIYDHDLKPNVNVTNNWQLFSYSFLTNSLGFRDSKNKIISKKNNENKKRILLIGDSFLEGMGYEYEKTLAGLIEDNFKNNYEIFNSGVASYSPGIYYLKTKYYLDKGYEFDQAVVFLDLSDIYDEFFYYYNPDKTKIINHELAQKKSSSIKKYLYNSFVFLKSNTVFFQLLFQISDQAEIYKNYIKLKYKASKEFQKSFFSTSFEEVMFYRMITVDRGHWTYSENNYLKVTDGIFKSKYFLKKLFKLLNDHQIKSYLVIYPWPSQIYYGDKYHQTIWKEFASENNINFISLYNEFDFLNSKKTILENFILGDVHWNSEGTKKIFNGLLKSNIF